MGPPKKDEFSESDRAALEHARQDLIEHQHRAWLRTSAGKIIKWLLAAIAAVTVLSDAAVRLWKAFLS